MWYAVYSTSNGRLVSIGEAETAPDIAGLTALQLLGKPDLSVQMWDEETRVFVARPEKVLIDRLTDIQNNPNFQDFMDAFQTLSAVNRTKLRAAIIRLIGRYRFRAVSESAEL